MPVSIGAVLAAVAIKADAQRAAVVASEAAYQAAQTASLAAEQAERQARIAKAEAVAVLTGRIVYDKATNKVYRVVNGEVDAVTPDSPEVEVVVPPVDIDGDGEPDNGEPADADDASVPLGS